MMGSLARLRRYLTFALCSTMFAVAIAQEPSWVLIPAFSTAFRVQDMLFASESDIYIAGRTDGVIHSGDRGASWQQLTSGLGSADVVRIARLPSGAVLAAAGGTGGVFRLQSDGSWRRSDLQTPTTGLVINRRNEAIAYSQSVVYRSTDGDHFTRVVQVNTGIGQVLARAPNGDLWAGTEGSGVFRSTDDGNTWQNAGDKVNGSAFGFSARGDVLYAERAAVWRYTGGTTWVHSDTGLPNSPRVFTFATNGAGQMFAGLSGGAVYVSDDNGQSWRRYSSGLPATFVVGALGIDPAGVLYAGGGERGGGLYRTSASTGGAQPPSKPPAPANLRIVH